MRIADLDPHWLEFEGRRVGFIFRCPQPAPDKRRWWQTCFVEKFYTFKGRNGTYASRSQGFAPDSQCGIIGACLPEAREWFQPCNPDHLWQVTPPIAEATFENISVTPSLDGSAGGLWHGFITNGAIVGGL